MSLLLRRLGQPPVIGEMTAGIVLGPIVFGALAPGLHARVFEPASLPALDGLSQVGLALFMASALSITAFPIMARILKERG